MLNSRTMNTKSTMSLLEKLRYERVSKKVDWTNGSLTVFIHIFKIYLALKTQEAFHCIRYIFQITGAFKEFVEHRLDFSNIFHKKIIFFTKKTSFSHKKSTLICSNKKIASLNYAQISFFLPLYPINCTKLPADYVFSHSFRPSLASTST